MDKDEIRKQLLNELTVLQKEFNIPQAEIDRAVLQFEDLIPLLKDKDNLLEQLADDILDSVKYRANIGFPDTIPDDMIVENIPNQPNLDKVESDELEKIFGDEKLNPDYDPELGRKGVIGEDYIAKYAEDFAEFTDGRITSLPDNHIFVFGSNTAGRHGKGAALDARNNFGAIPGQGYGLQGQSFGIPTKDGNLNVLDNAQIKKYVDRFLEFAKSNPNKTFVVTAIGTGLAGKNPDEIAAMFSDVPKNVILSQKFSGGQGGSLGAAKLNDPNIFPEKLDELYDENVHTDFKRNILDQLDYEGKKVLSFFNEHPVVKEAQLNGESVLLGLYKFFGPKFLEKYDNIKNMNAGTKVVLGATKFATKRTYGIGKFLLNTLRALDPVGEGIELASKIATKTGLAKSGGAVSKYGTKAGSNLLYELKNQIVWQTAAAVIAGVENGAMAFNSVLDKYGLFPQALKDAGVEVVPYQDVMKEAANNYRYWQSKYWQASKTTSLMYMLDTAIPSVFTGQSMPTRFQKGLTGAMLPPVLNEKTLGDLKLSAEDREFWNIVSGWDVTDTRAKQDKWYHILPGFSLNSNWLQNEMEQTGTLFEPSYYSQVENPNLNEYQQDNHVSVYNRLEKLINRFGKDIEPIGKEAIDYYDNVLKGVDE